MVGTFRRRLGLLFLLTLCVGSLLVGWIWHWSGTPLATMTHERLFVLRPGQSFSSFLSELTQAGIIDSPVLLRVLAEWRGDTTRLQAGEYLVPAASTPESLLDLLVSGDVVTHRVRIADGVTTEVMLEALNGNPLLSNPLELNDLTGSLGIEVPFIEGIFLPETYSVIRGDSVGSVLARAHADLQGVLESAWLRRNDACEAEDKWQLLILASIIEKESGFEPDRRQISQVFNRRLHLGMRLQTDPTVIYALGDAFDGDLRRRDLRFDSPFNTYVARGLPPTPIALPSVASIEAAAQPADGDFLYFVARGDGTSQFSRTLEEHNAAVRKFQLKAQ